MPTRARQLSVLPSQPPTKLQEAGHAWLAHLRAEGRSYREIFTAEDPPLILDLIRANLQSLLDVGSRLRRAEARALHDQGMTMDQIAELFGVTRQRVSALLREVREP